jgi:hypothetical protein
MKFLCKDEFMHSGDKIYTAGTVYELSEETVNKLVMVDKNHIGGALRFFTPVDEAAAVLMKAIHTRPVLPHAQPVTPPAQPPAPPAPPAPPSDTPAPPAPPSRETLVREAKSLGIKVPFGTSNNDLMMLITAARQRLPPQE